MQRFFTILFGISLFLFSGIAHAANKQAENKQYYAKIKYSSIIVDSDTLEILHARQIDELRYPASLTKMMTLYLVFDALDDGRLKIDEKIKVSAKAANTPPVKLGLKRGGHITTREAIQALTIMSGNDVAVVLAERLGGSEQNFAKMMTAKAKALGMQRTIFKNANGLPNPEQFTTARDMAKLAQALLQNHARYYHYFGQKSFYYNNKIYHNHNALLGQVAGVDGFKTGYTRASGYNLVLSAQRDGRRLVAVVLGGASGKTRNAHMRDLIERGFKVQNQIASARHKANMALNSDEKRKVIVREPVKKNTIPQAFTLRGSHKMNAKTLKASTQRIVNSNGFTMPNKAPMDNWQVQVGSFVDAQSARQASMILMAQAELGLTKAKPVTASVNRAGRIVYRARIGGLSFTKANETCKALARHAKPCLVIAPN